MTLRWWPNKVPVPFPGSPGKQNVRRAPVTRCQGAGVHPSGGRRADARRGDGQGGGVGAAGALRRAQSPRGPVAHRTRGCNTQDVAEHDDLLARIVEQLDQDDSYELQGELERSPWGSGQWVKYTDPQGEVHYLRVVVEPYRRP